MSIKKTLVCAAIAASAFAAQAQNLVVDGSFEATSVTGGKWITVGSTLGWTGDPNIEIRNAAAGNAQQGFNFVELDTGGNSSMYQDVIASAGLYQLSFWYSPRQSVAAGSNGLSFTFGNLSNNVLANVAGSGSGNVWQQYTSNVLLTGNTRLTFSAIGKSDSYGGSLDNVSVTAVPEPETYAMMLAGLALMGTIARRRKNKAA